MPWLNKPKVVVDTNVFVSGVLFGGNPEKILRQVSQRIISLVISPDIKAEILRKLEKFEVGEADLEKLESNIRRLPPCGTNNKSKYMP